MRYPFMSAVNEYLAVYKGIYSEGMLSELNRRYPKISRQIRFLYESGRISSTNPSKMTPEDVREYAKYLRARGLKPSSVGHDISSLSMLCKYCGNNCVDTARSKYPLLFPKRTHDRLPVTERPEFDYIVKVAGGLKASDDYLRIRAYAAVLFAFGTGSRTLELQHAKLHNLSPDLKTFLFTHVKGKDTYGRPRPVPIRKEVRPILSLYLTVRPEGSDYLFPSPEGRYLSGNILQRSRRLVCEETGVEFDYRKCRRTYAQYLVDAGFPIDHVAVILGHSNTKTTENSYARPRPDRVVSEILEVWG